jgi:hypothetical protein
VKSSLWLVLLASLSLTGCAELLAIAAASASSSAGESEPSAEDAAAAPTTPATCGTLCAKALTCANVTGEQDFNDCTATCRDGNIEQDQINGLQALDCTELLKTLGLAPQPPVVAPSASAPPR